MENYRVGIEIPVFLVFFSIMLGGPVTTNFIIYRTCYVIMGKEESACAKLGWNTTDNATMDLEKEVQPVANYINIVLTMVTQSIPCFASLFIGPWSDKIGRKPILIISLIGYFIACSIKTLISAIPSLSPWFLFMESIPTILSGGMATFIVIAFCYLVDVTEPENRGLRHRIYTNRRVTSYMQPNVHIRNFFDGQIKNNPHGMGILEGILGVGGLIGTLFSSFVFELVGYIGVFLLCTLLILLALVITLLFLDETITPSVIPENHKLFTLVHMKEMCNVTFKRRIGYNRILVLICVASMIMFIMAEGNSGTEQLLLRAKFHWNLEKLTLYSSIRSIISMAGGVFGIVVLHEIIGVPECPLIVIGFMCVATNTFMVAVAQYDWQIYVAACMRTLVGVIGPMVRSFLSKIIPHDEIGKVFSFGISLETLVGVLAGPLFTVVYTNTINKFPGAFDLIPFYLHVVNLIFYIFIMILKARSNTIVYVEIDQQDLQ